MPSLRLSIAALCAVTALAASPAAGVDLTLELDHAQPVRLSAPASAIIVGNPVVADVTPHDGETLLVTGKSFGATNIIVLNADGDAIYEAEVRVVDRSENRLMVNRGLARESYVCFGECQRTAIPGDANETFQSVMEARTKAIAAAAAEAQPK
jgi:hypothetical protein